MKPALPALFKIIDLNPAWWLAAGIGKATPTSAPAFLDREEPRKFCSGRFWSAILSARFGIRIVAIAGVDEGRAWSGWSKRNVARDGVADKSIDLT